MTGTFVGSDAPGGFLPSGVLRLIPPTINKQVYPLCPNKHPIPARFMDVPIWSSRAAAASCTSFHVSASARHADPTQRGAAMGRPGKRSAMHTLQRIQIALILMAFIRENLSEQRSLTTKFHLSKEVVTMKATINLYVSHVTTTKPRMMAAASAGRGGRLKSLALLYRDRRV